MPSLVTLLAGVSALAAVWLFATIGTARDAPSDASVGRYGRNLPAPAGATLRYPDFELRYVGERAATGPPTPGAQEARGVVHDYRVSAGGLERTVSWPEGPGMSMPVPFEIAGHRFALERGRSILGPHGALAEGEIVVWRGEDADRIETASAERRAREGRARQGGAAR
jgi:hypothetical protein